jgi:Leucine-rich repeat (LRR) protein
MVGGVKILYAVLLALVLGVGCGESKEEKEKAAKAKATVEAKVTALEATKAAAKTTGEAKAEANVVAWVSDPNDPNNVTIEAAIRKSLKYIGESPTGELTQADLEKVTELELDRKQLTSVKGLEKLTQLESLHLPHNKLTDVKGLEKLTQLERLSLGWNKLTDVKGLEKLTQLTRLGLTANPDLTKAQIAELKEALPNCEIFSNPTK